MASGLRVAASLVGLLLVATPATAACGRDGGDAPEPAATALDGARYYLRENIGIEVYSVHGATVTKHHWIRSTEYDPCLASSVALSPDGAWLAWVADDDGDGVGTLTVATVNGANPRTLENVSCRLSSSDFSGDSRRLTISGPNGQQDLDLATWTTQPQSGIDAVWSRHGKAQAYPRRPGPGEGFRVVAADGKVLAEVDNYTNDSPAYRVCGYTLGQLSDDGRYVTIGYCATALSRIPARELYDTQTGRRVDLPVEPAEVMLVHGGAALVWGMAEDDYRPTVYLINMDGTVLDEEKEPEALPGDAGLLQYVYPYVPSTVTVPSPSESTFGDGRITMAELLANPVDLPRWSELEIGEDAEQNCPTTAARLREAWNYEANTNIVAGGVAFANLDQDPDLETAALVRCVGLGEYTLDQVVALDRGSDGAIVTLGRIVAGNIDTIAANPSRGVDVDVSDMRACCGTPAAKEYHQIRTFAWNGSRFVQIAGPTSFTTHANPIDLGLEVLKIELGPLVDVATADGGAWQERDITVTLRITNAGPVKSNPFAIISIDDPGWGYQQPPLAAGESRTVPVVLHGSWPRPVPTALEVYELGGVADANLDNNVVAIDLPQT